MTQLTTVNKIELTAVPTRYGKDITPQNSQHIKEFNEWCANILNPDLTAYRDYLSSADRGLSPASVLAHITNVRRAYKALLKDRTLFYSFVPDDLSMSDRKAYVDEAIERINNGLDVSVKQNEDTTQQGYRMSKGECIDFLAMFNGNKKHWLMIALLLATGIRISELVKVTVKDLEHYEDNEPALLIRNGKGNKSRAVFWGGMFPLVYKLLGYATTNNIGDDSPLFEMSTRSVEYIITRKAYKPAKANDIISAHDLRRTYARLMYDNGMSVEAIKENMGHKSIKTTLDYIGEINAESRQPLNLFGW